jgi:hypothetical protein
MGIERTLKSLKRVSDFPFYTATYDGDYSLAEYMAGAVTSPADVGPFFEALFRTQGLSAQIRLPSQARAFLGCSAFFARSADGKPIVGKNLDWRKDPILLLKTQRPSAYSSLTIVDLALCDIFGLGSMEASLILSPYVPFDGMNEKGLVVSMLSVQEESRYPSAPSKVTVGDFNMIRILLDTCGSVGEAVSTFDTFNVVQTGPAPIHYLLADADGACIVELADGRVSARKSAGNLYLTNFLVNGRAGNAKSLAFCDRFRRLHDHLGDNENTVSDLEAKKLLDSVSVFNGGYAPPSTIWSVIFRPDSLELAIRIGKERRYYRLSIDPKR